MPTPDNQRRHAKQKAHRRTTKHWQQVRAQVIARDGGRCRKCRKAARSVHLDPALQGRHDLATPDNCILLCGKCHGQIDGGRSNPGGGSKSRAARTQSARAAVKFPPPDQKTSARGYGLRHQQLRKQWSRKVAQGEVSCARCRELIAPDGAPCEKCGKPTLPGGNATRGCCGWDLGHVDWDKSRYAGPEHACCNRATRGRRVARSDRW